MIERRRRKLHPLIPIASMGDIAFLLIIFFLLTSNFIKEAHVQVTPPASPDVDTLEEHPVSVTMDEEGILWLQGRECPPDLLESSVSGLLENRKDKVVTVKIDKSLTQDRFGDVLLALSRAGAEIALIGRKANR